MGRNVLSKYVTPWKFRRDELRRRVEALRARDGENCRRCRRPIRFDLPAGHDRGPKIESIVEEQGAGFEAFENLLLCHGRCNADGIDHTGEVQDRVRRKNEAALFARSRSA
jgi:hypothetical protein